MVGTLLGLLVSCVKASFLGGSRSDSGWEGRVTLQ